MKRLLHRMQLAVRGRPRPSIVVTLAPSTARREACSSSRHAVDMHDAGAALAGVAADMGAGQAEFLAQQFADAASQGSTSTLVGLPLSVKAIFMRLLLNP